MVLGARPAISRSQGQCWNLWVALSLTRPATATNTDLAWSGLCSCAAGCGCSQLTAVGFEPTQLALVELESTPLDHSGKLSLVHHADAMQMQRSAQPHLCFASMPRSSRIYASRGCQEAPPVAALLSARRHRLTGTSPKAPCAQMAVATDRLLAGVQESIDSCGI